MNLKAPKIKKNKAKRVFRAFLPGAQDLTKFVKAMVIMMILATFGFLFLYSSTGAQAGSDSNVSSLAQSAAQDQPGQINSLFTSTLVFGLTAPVSGAPIAKEMVTGVSAASTTYYNGEPQMHALVDYGATGRLINATAGIYQTPATSPREVVQYYADRAAGRAYAANPTSGREVLTPIFYLSQAMRNVAYGVIVIVLIVSSLSILLSSLMGGEQKLTIVQLMMNTGVTLVLCTLFYEIAAILYDLCVNYGNAVVASVMEPFINANVILDRLSPGGDLNITAVMNTFQFVGTSDAIIQIMQNVTSGLYPAITQSMSAVPEAAGGNGSSFNLIGASLGFFAGGLSIAINRVGSNLLGSTALFNAIIAWTLFILNLKIFFNLLDAFIKFNLYTAFGPILVLQGVNNGYEKIVNLFKLMAAYALVFPTTFLFILLGATTMNIFIRNDAQAADPNNNGVEKTVLCSYAPDDPQNTEDGILGRDILGETANSLLFMPDNKYDDPKDFRYRNYINQDIFDVTPQYVKDGVRNCRSKLFPVPWTFVPAPFGNYGNRLVQTQTIDALVRTFLAIAFIIIAGRTPAILIELLDAKEMRSLQGLGKALLGGIQPTLGFGVAALGSSVGMLFKSIGGAANLKLPVIGAGLEKVRTSKWLNSVRVKGADLGKNNASLADVYAQLSKPTPESQASALRGVGEKVDGIDKALDEDLKANGLNQPGDEMRRQEIRNLYMDRFVLPQMADSYKTLSMNMGTLNSIVSTNVNIFQALSSSANDLLGQIKSLTNLINASLIDNV
jgi:hypothetical protein